MTSKGGIQKYIITPLGEGGGVKDGLNLQQTSVKCQNSVGEMGEGPETDKKGVL